MGTEREAEKGPDSDRESGAQRGKAASECELPLGSSAAEENVRLEELRARHPEKFVGEEIAFRKINAGARIFIGTGCGEPQYLVAALIKYVEEHPKAFFDAEILHVWSLGVAPYTDEKFKDNFRHNSFFIGGSTRDAVNRGGADYTPIFLSAVPELFHNKMVPVDVALIQTSPPDSHGYMSLGISVDIVKAAVENASVVIAQVNANMPRVHGDTFINIKDVDFVIHHDEPLMEYTAEVSDEISHRIGKYVAQIIQDGDTIQVGYGSLPNAILSSLSGKRHLGVHTELLTDGIVDLMKAGVIDNSMKTIEHDKTLATFCMAKKSTYDFLHDNPGIEFKPVEYVNNPLIIAQNRRMCAINSALEIDLTGQATAESVGRVFYSGVGGQADFMRGAVLSPGGKAILAMQSTAGEGAISRIVPSLKEGAGVTLTRGDIHYVVTEFGIAYLHGKNIRERAMDLIAIAHPKFRPMLIQEAKKNNLIYADQAFIPGMRGEYPEHFETVRTTRRGLRILLRPVKVTDEPLLKDFFYSLSENSLYRRFIQMRKDMPHERLQDFVVIDYTKEMVILAVEDSENKERVLGVGQYGINENSHTAEVALVVRDDFQGKGVGWELLSYLTYLAKRQGLHGFTAEVLVDNIPMLRLFENMGFDTNRRSDGEVYLLKMGFRGGEGA
jgi:acyl-CoA hydrolase/GNAT superfamily N-acetyltransferase